MADSPFQMSLYLPAQGAAETEATILEWYVGEGDAFEKGQVLAQVDSAKSVFDFEAPCDGKVVRLLHTANDEVQLSDPVVEIETSDPTMRNWIPPAASGEEIHAPAELPAELPAVATASAASTEKGIVLLGVGSYLPARCVSNAELVEQYPDVNEDYVHQVTGIHERYWAADDEKPSDMAEQASREAVRKAGLDMTDIDAIVLSTSTPDVAMPSTACILQNRLELYSIPAFDLNAACSGWLYAVSMARGMIVSGLAKNVLTVGVDLQSRLLDPSDRNAYFIFGDGAGAAVISARDSGHTLLNVRLSADPRGLRLARREEPGFEVTNGQADVDPWIRLEGGALFRMATESFTNIIRESIAESGWQPEETRWVVPHQANGRILKAAAKRSGIPFERFFLNVDHVGNTSSASIPLALCEMEEGLAAGDKLVLCSVGAGLTTAAITVEW